MKKCHTCGQKLPLKVGNVVSGQYWTRTGYKGFQGIVLKESEHQVDVALFNSGEVITVARRNVGSILHGYYRITEREPLA